MNKKILISALALSIIGVASYGVTKTNAQNLQSGYTSIIQKLATKFGVKEDDVKAVFDQQRSERQAQMQVNNEARLAKLVTDGKITEAQKQLILAKHKELQDKHANKQSNWYTMTREERQTYMQNDKTELETWAKANNIDTQYLMMGRGFKGMGRGMKDKGKFIK